MMKVVEISTPGEASSSAVGDRLITIQLTWRELKDVFGIVFAAADDDFTMSEYLKYLNISSDRLTELAELCGTLRGEIARDISGYQLPKE